MSMYDVIIIGGGLGGLQCGYLLSKEGMKVCLLDKNSRFGGMIQSFVRDGVVFNTGLNYTESLAEGEVLHRYFKLFGLIGNLTLKQLDQDKTEIICLGDNEYIIPQGHDRYVDALSSYFPSERKAIVEYMHKLKDVCHSFPLYRLSPDYTGASYESPYMQICAADYIDSITQNEDLRGVLAGNNILHAGQREASALHTHALINYSFIKSAWRIKEGGSGLANVLVNGIKSNGGDVYRDAEVTKLNVKDGLIHSASLENGEIIKTKNVISSLHPKSLMALIEAPDIKKVYRNRIMAQKDSIGMFSVYIALKENVIPYQNYNHHVFKSNNVWTTDSEEWPQNYLMYTQYNQKTNDFANGITIISYMKYSEVEKWATTRVENRGADYEEFKTQKAEQLITMAEQRIPELRKSIKRYYTSTPLTYRDYTGSFEGSAYGIIKDFKNPLHSIISPQSRIKNLLLTGQNLNMHGILGVSISSFLTCSLLLGEEYLYKKLIETGNA